MEHRPEFFHRRKEGQGHKSEALQSQKMARRKAGSVQQSRRGNCDPKPRERKIFFFPKKKQESQH